MYSIIYLLFLTTFFLATLCPFITAQAGQ